MIVLLHLTAVILKSIHLFLMGNSRDLWFCFAINRNIIILLLMIANFLLLKALNNRFMQFSKFIKDPAKDIYKKFIYNLEIILKLSKCALQFWVVSCIFSNIDFIISYNKIQIHIIFLIAELFPYFYILLKANKLLFKLIKGDYKDVCNERLCKTSGN